MTAHDGLFFAQRLGGISQRNECIIQKLATSSGSSLTLSGREFQCEVGKLFSKHLLYMYC
jgi:hypothetical protein